LTLRERRVQANVIGRDSILMPGCPGAPRGPAANPITGIAARSRQRVQFTPSHSSLTEVVEGLEDSEPERCTSDEGSCTSLPGAVSESGSGGGGAGGVAGGVPGGTASRAPPPEQPRRLISFGSFSFHRESDMGENSFSWSLLNSGSELIDMVSNFLPGFPSRPTTPCDCSPTRRPPSPRTLARTVSAEMCNNSGSEESIAPGNGPPDPAASPPPRHNGEPAVLAPYSTIESGAIPTLPTLVLPGRKPPPFRSTGGHGHEEEQANAAAAAAACCA
jgi:hypothetical protein